MKKLLCKLLGHKYKYNFVSFASKCECTRCGRKWKTINNPAYNGKNLFEEAIYTWEEIKTVEKGEYLDFDIPEQDDILEQIMGRV